MGSAASAQPDSPDAEPMTKLQLYRKLRAEFQKIQQKQTTDPQLNILPPEELDQLAMGELSRAMGTSEALLGSILTSSTPKQKARSPGKYLVPADSIPESATAFSPLPSAERGSPLLTGSQRKSLVISPTPLDVKLNMSYRDPRASPVPPSEGEAAGAAAPDLADVPPPSPRVAAEEKSQKCGALIKSLTQEVYHHYVVGMDGSEVSMTAFKTALTLRKKKGKMYVLHVKDLTKNAKLPLNLRWEGISETTESFLAPTMPKSCYSLDAIVKTSEQSTKEVFVEHVNSIDQGVFVCLGWTGRKGLKDDPTVLGQVADVTMKTCQHPVIICKKEPSATEPHHYMICVDADTSRGMWAFDTITSLSRRVDLVTVVYCYENGDDEKMLAVKKEYDAAIKMNGFDPKLVSFKGIDKPGGTPVHQCLTDFLGEEMPTFAVVAPDVNLARPELSVSEKIIKNVKSNVIILKIPKDLE